MIELMRPPVPASLNTPAMHQYIQDCATYAAACAVAIDPSTVPRPNKPGDYRTSDVLQAFDTGFFAKCYLTEHLHGSSYEMDVDHFVPVNQNPTLKYAWDNLFPAAHKANMMRPRQWPTGGLLNPCNDRVSTRLSVTIGALGRNPKFEAADPTDQAARNTADLLNLLHNGKVGDEVSRLNTKHLRVTIMEQSDRVMRAILKFLAAQNSNNPQALANSRRQLGDLLSRQAPFTQLMRSMDAVVEFVPPDLLD